MIDYTTSEEDVKVLRILAFGAYPRDGGIDFASVYTVSDIVAYTELTFTEVKKSMQRFLFYQLVERAKQFPRKFCITEAGIDRLNQILRIES